MSQSPPSSPSDHCDIASVGIGALIVFIAMVLVAGIAASVLVQSSTQLEMQALRTGQETINEVASGIKVEGIGGHNSSGLIDKIAIEITANAGSPDVDLGASIVEISDSTTKFVLNYNNDFTNQSSVNGDLFSNGNFGDSTHFGIIVLQDADESCTQTNPIINYGDHIAISVNANAIFNSLAARTDVSGLIVCEEGSPGIIGFSVPASISTAVVILQ
jgi:flagellin FlaB